MLHVLSPSKPEVLWRDTWKLFGAQASNSNELSERVIELELLITKTSTKRALSKKYEKIATKKCV